MYIDVHKCAHLFPLIYSHCSVDLQDLVMDEVRKHFKPEFVNRIDEFIIFDPLRYFKNDSWICSLCDNWIGSLV